MDNLRLWENIFSQGRYFLIVYNPTSANFQIFKFSNSQIVFQKNLYLFPGLVLLV
jgi:hypothetical protein